MHHYEEEILYYMNTHPERWFRPREIVGMLVNLFPEQRFPPSGGQTSVAYITLYRLVTDGKVERRPADCSENDTRPRRPHMEYRLVKR